MLAPFNANAEVSANLQREKIYIDETVRIIIDSDQIENSVQPDFSVLNASFNVLGTTTNQSVSIVNGQQTSLRRWIAELKPKSPGSFTIPPIWVGNEKTKTQRITVLPKNPEQNSELRDVFVELSVHSINAFVQQQIDVVVKLYLGVEILNGNLSEPAPENTDVVRIGNDIQYESKVGDRNYRVIERRYALFSKQSGQLDIPYIQFRGVVRDTETGGNRTFQGLFNQGIRIQAKSDAAKVTIHPPDPSFSGKTWLPAKRVEILDMSTEYGDVYVGQPITRQIRLRAAGLTSDQLPEIEFLETPNIKQYPDNITRNTKQQNDDVIGIVDRSVAIIATEPGKLSLPEIKLNWWNTETGEMEAALLPQKEISILPDPASTEIVSFDSALNIPSVSEEISTASNSNLPPKKNGIWKWISLILLVGWGITFLWFRQKTNFKANHDFSDRSEILQSKNLSNVLSEIKNACDNNRASETRSLIQNWAKLRWPNLSLLSLEEISQKLDSPQLSAELVALDDHLYARNNKPWSAPQIHNLLTKFSATNQINTEKGSKVLPVLYPQSG